MLDFSTSYKLTQQEDHVRICFNAMANGCEILLRSDDLDHCHAIAKMAVQETFRLEKKYSRYLKQNLTSKMNQSNGKLVRIDRETYQLLEYARNLFELSEGMFDISSGVLRKIWRFTSESKPPSEKEIQALVANIGFKKIQYDQQSYTMPEKMEIDFGGIGKEYAVDQVCNLIREDCKRARCSFLVNFGGDISAESHSDHDPEWIIGIEESERDNSERDNKAPPVIKLRHGCVATSGNSKQFLLHQNKRYGHLLNPKTGYPIDGSPLSVTAFAGSCVLAGSFSSLAMLQGKRAEEFLQQQNIKFICNW